MSIVVSGSSCRSNTVRRRSHDLPPASHRAPGLGVLSLHDKNATAKDGNRGAEVNAEADEFVVSRVKHESDHRAIPLVFPRRLTGGQDCSRFRRSVEAVVVSVATAAGYAARVARQSRSDDSGSDFDTDPRPKNANPITAAGRPQAQRLTQPPRSLIPPADSRTAPYRRGTRRRDSYQPFFLAKRLLRSASTFVTLNCTYSRSRSSWLSFCISRRSSSLRSSSRRPRFRPGGLVSIVTHRLLKLR